MAESEVEGVRKRSDEPARERSNQEPATYGGGWSRISYERRDGRVQVQYLLFDSRGRVHSVIDGAISAEAERRHHDVAKASGTSGGIVRVSMVSRGGWTVTRMGGEMDIGGE